MGKSGSIIILLLSLLVGDGNFLTMERGFAVDHANVTSRCQMPKACSVHSFTDWFKVGRYCVKYFRTPANFTEAELMCRTKAPGAHLVSVHSSRENNDLNCIVKKFSPKNLRFWLGGFEFFMSGTFFWIDGSHWDYQFWTSGEPNHMYTNTEECVEMNWKGIGRWNDDNCYTKKSYICAFKERNMLEEEPE